MSFTFSAYGFKSVNHKGETGCFLWQGIEVDEKFSLILSHGVQLEKRGLASNTGDPYKQYDNNLLHSN
jgi:hypothetical protein